MHAPIQTRSRVRRWLHLLLAAVIVHQMVVSAVMEVPNPKHGHPGNLWWSFHEYGGLVAFAVVFLFWAASLVRTAAVTGPGAWFPWWSPIRLKALRDDAAGYLRAALRGRLPAPDDASPLAAAVQGLGLLLVSVMALTGTLWWLGRQLGGAWPTLGHWMIEIHGTLGNLVWYYLALHVGATLLHELFGHRVLRPMSPV